MYTGTWTNPIYCVIHLYIIYCHFYFFSYYIRLNYMTLFWVTYMTLFKITPVRELCRRINWTPNDKSKKEITARFKTSYCITLLLHLIYCSKVPLTRDQDDGSSSPTWFRYHLLFSLYFTLLDLPGVAALHLYTT